MTSLTLFDVDCCGYAMQVDRREDAMQVDGNYQPLADK